MKVIIDELNEWFGENVRLVKSLKKRERIGEFPEPFKWKLQLLYFDSNAWREICRIDNYLHEQKQGCHIHIYGKKGTKRIETTFQKADALIKEMSKEIIRKKFKEHINFEGKG